MLSRERCQEIFAEILRYSDADETELILAGGSSELTRFANNTIHQNVAEEGYSLSVRTVYGSRTARASTNKFDSESLRRVVAEASSLTRQQQPDPELLPMPGPQEYRPVERYFEATAAVTPAERAQAVRRAIEIAEKSGQTAAGTFSTSAGMQAIFNSRGLAGYYPRRMFERLTRMHWRRARPRPPTRAATRRNCLRASTPRSSSRRRCSICWASCSGISRARRCGTSAVS